MAEIKEEKFHDWDARKWNAFYRAINDEKPVEKCGLELNEEEKEAYKEKLKWLLNERKSYPLASYQDTFELEWD